MNVFIGWDVGGWNCEKNRKSRDAVCVLAGESLEKLSIVGTPFRGNIRKKMQQSGSLKIVELCQRDCSYNNSVLAIDTPLGWPQSFLDLIARSQIQDIPERAGANPYLFRRTEQYLYRMGFTPLSAIKDMIGSQSTKGLHFLKFGGYEYNDLGVWKRRDGQHFAIEAYPAPISTSCKLKVHFDKLSVQGGFDQIAKAESPAREDLDDSLWCALIAALWYFSREECIGPEYMNEQERSILQQEGWIWIPKDCKPAPRKVLSENTVTQLPENSTRSRSRMAEATGRQAALTGPLLQNS